MDAGGLAGLSGAGVATGTPPEDPARVRELAGEFEAMFIALMLRQMRESLVLSGEEDAEAGFGKTTFAETFDTELARHLAAGGGIGIASVIVEAYERQRAGVPPAGAAPLPQAASPPASASPAVPLPPGSRITSPFGWRRDPIGGEDRLHRGVDIRAAHGDPVPVVADGAVLVAGTQGGYGLTVVVEHGSGIRTRYAHLSELRVSPGDTVRRGQEVGRAGATGRATGAHLHFEVLDGARAVDPVRAARRYAEAAGLKALHAGADWSGGGPSEGPALEE